MAEQTKIAFEIKWRIENLLYWFQKRDDTLYSPQFLVETLMNTGWKLSLSRKWHLAESYISLAFHRDVNDDYLLPIVLNYELSFLANGGSVLKAKYGKMRFDPKTVSQELNVKEVEIFKEKRDTFLPEGRLTIGCKLWKAWDTSKEEQCLIRSVVGRKSVALDGNIYYFSELLKKSVLTANFISLSPDISFVSFDVLNSPLSIEENDPLSYAENFVLSYEDDYTLSFENGKVECESLNFHSFKLNVLGDEGHNSYQFDDNGIRLLLTSQESYEYETHLSYVHFHHLLENDTLSLQLEISYSPGIESECIEYANNCKNLSDESSCPVSMDSFNTEKVHASPKGCLHIAKESDIEGNIFVDENECFVTAETRKLPSTTFKEDLTSLYNDRLFCDTKLRTDSETFPAHRSVLSARSPVFKKMFTTDMKEKASDSINVPDISSETVRRMLQFLYTDCIGDLDMQSATDLYIASDKYDIASLKQRCSTYIKENLCPANVCEVIKLADMHQDVNLEYATHDFVLTNDEEVFGSEEWRLFMKNSSSLAAKVMYLKCMKK